MSDIRACVEFYRRKGFRPLPSRSDRKGPTLLTYGQFWTEPVPDQVYSDWSAQNVQLLTGTVDTDLTLVVIDTDGHEAMQTWDIICQTNGGIPDTWAVDTGGGGRHYWFLIDSPHAAGPSRKVWGIWNAWPVPDGTWVKHKEIRIIATRGLVVAPPSVHVDTGIPYRFVPGHGPRDMDMPSFLPAWVAALPGLPDKPFTAPPPLKPHRPFEGGGESERDRVLNGIPDKIGFAREMGLRVVGRQCDGWVTCRAIDREDRRPSGRINASTGVYHDRATGQSMSYIDLIKELGKFPTWKDALSHLSGVSHAEPVLRVHRA